MPVIKVCLMIAMGLFNPKRSGCTVIHQRALPVIGPSFLPLLALARRLPGATPPLSEGGCWKTTIVSLLGPFTGQMSHL